MYNRALINSIKLKECVEAGYIESLIQKGKIDVMVNDNEAMKTVCSLNDSFWIKRLHLYGSEIGKEEHKILFDANVSEKDFNENIFFLLLNK